MLWNASAINGYAIEASDGRLGTVSDLLFEDVGWVIRSLVVDTSWQEGPSSAFGAGHPDRSPRHFYIKLTMQQVEDSPDVHTDQPESRQIKARVHDYFGWDPYWGRQFSPCEQRHSDTIRGTALRGKSNPHDLVRADVQPK